MQNAKCKMENGKNIFTFASFIFTRHTENQEPKAKGGGSKDCVYNNVQVYVNQNQDHNGDDDDEHCQGNTPGSR